MARQRNRFGNLGQVAAKMARRADAIKDEHIRAAGTIGKIVHGEVLRILDEKIYKADIPARTWKLTYKLRKSQKVVIDGTTVTLKSEVKHSGPRHRLGTPVGRAIKTPGVQSVQWQDEAVKNTRDRVSAVRRKATLAALKG